jgi:predicted MFS family arabinose efflux permease
MFADPRRLAVALAGLCAFLDLYATQPLLPLFAQSFGATPAQVSLTVSATTLAVALVAPFVGLLADSVGRKRVIVAAMFTLLAPTIAISFATDLHQLIVLRFVQGLLLPAIFGVTVAYIGDEWPIADVPAVTGIYISGSALGGFLGRFISGVVSEAFGWRSAFLVLAAITLMGAVVTARFLPRESHFVRSTDLVNALRTMIGHLRNRRLIATFVIGFAVLFSFVSSLTYVNFYLAAPPFGLTSAGLGSIFFVYLFGVVSTPMSAAQINRFGRRAVVNAMTATWIAGFIVTLYPALWVVIVGLSISVMSGFMVQTCATSYLASAATHGRSSAVGLYVTFYYIGGSLGAILPAPAWHRFGWPGCVAVTSGALLIAAALSNYFWRTPKTGTPQTGTPPAAAA